MRECQQWPDQSLKPKVPMEETVEFCRSQGGRSVIIFTHILVVVVRSGLPRQQRSQYTSHRVEELTFVGWCHHWSIYFVP